MQQLVAAKLKPRPPQGPPPQSLFGQRWLRPNLRSPHARMPGCLPKAHSKPKLHNKPHDATSAKKVKSTPLTEIQSATKSKPSTPAPAAAMQGNVQQYGDDDIAVWSLLETPIGRVEAAAFE